ncbi:MarR family winged helix-turn-helix transcriptional regulator [Gordonia bronchialis]|uniref:MarR family winged helix-turn-helix transcriptional regulator n=1 Tax=Gordonia bronchialis TaxID=2054 RepID=UPI00226E63C8|nr:MarR family transcriptional regulator [Gordonia bronchialis]
MPDSAVPTASDDERSCSVDAAYAALLEFLDRLACLGKAHTMDSLAATDLTFSQLKVMFALGAHEAPMSVNEIADHVHLSLAAAGRTVDKLVVSDLVDRREDSTDRRVKRVSLTADGKQFLDSHLTIKQEIVRRFVSGLPANMRGDLCRTLRPIVDDDVDYFDISDEELSEIVAAAEKP